MRPEFEQINLHVDFDIHNDDHNKPVDRDKAIANWINVELQYLDSKTKLLSKR